MQRRIKFLTMLQAVPAAVCAMMFVSPVMAEELLTLKLIAKEGRFIPETLEVPAGRRFKIVITNDGPGPEEFESVELKKEKVLAPGATSFLVFAPLKPGMYRFFGEFHPETAKGQIVVK